MDKDFRHYIKKFWHFLWYEDSFLSWVVNIIFAFVLIKFAIYPGLGFILGTTHPVVAVVSESMEHNKGFDEWWENSKNWYGQNGITKEQFSNFKLKNGFNKGDIMVLHGKKAEDINAGDIIVFVSSKPDPIIHRVVKKTKKDGLYYFTTKGDNYKTNPYPIKDKIFGLDETDIKENQVIGAALLRIPFIGYIKIGFVNIISFLRQSLYNIAGTPIS